jgi:hypothetical protein
VTGHNDPPAEDWSRFTDRLRLEPIGVQHGDDLYRLHLDPAIAEWWDVIWTRDDARRHAARFATGWRDDGVIPDAENLGS